MLSVLGAVLGGRLLPPVAASASFASASLAAAAAAAAAAASVTASAASVTAFERHWLVSAHLSDAPPLPFLARRFLLDT